MIGRSIDLRQLRHVVVLADLLSYTRAAEALGISQSALSRSIQQVEASANLLLFDRDRAGVRLTPVGAAFVGRASNLLRQADELSGFVEHSSAAGTGSLSFGMTPLAAQALLAPALLERFVDSPQLHLRAVVRQYQALLPLFISDEIEFFVAIEGGVDTIVPLCSTPIGYVPGSLLVRRGHPILEQDPSTCAGDYPLIMSGYFGVPPRLPEFYQGFLRIPPRIVGESYHELEYLAERTDAVWLTMGLAAWNAIKQGRLCELQPPAPDQRWLMPLKLYSHPRRRLTSAALGLRDLFRARLAEMWRDMPNAPLIEHMEHQAGG